MLKGTLLSKKRWINYSWNMPFPDGSKPMRRFGSLVRFTLHSFCLSGALAELLKPRFTREEAQKVSSGNHTRRNQVRVAGEVGFTAGVKDFV